MTIVAATDGSSLGNPGPTGWAWVVDKDTWRAGGFPSGTNNIGELHAVLDLLEQTQHVDEPLRIMADSQYVIKALTQWIHNWKRNGWRTASKKPVQNAELIQRIDAHLQHRSVTFEWVKGHSGNALNEMADQRAVACSKAYQEGKPPQTGPGYNPSGSARPQAPMQQSASGTQSPRQAAPKQPNSALNSQRAHAGIDPRSQRAGTGFDRYANTNRAHINRGGSMDAGLFDLPGDKPAGTPNPVRTGAPTEGSTSNPARTETPSGPPASKPVRPETPTEPPATKPVRTKVPTEPPANNPVRTTATPREAAQPGPVIYKQRGYWVREHRFRVPLDHKHPDGRQINLFAREISADREPNPKQPAIIYMQGGPGGRAPRPGNPATGWMAHALKNHRVILMDERGTGLSTRLDHLTLSAFDTVDDQVEYVKHFRADQIVWDAEFLRHQINDGHPWKSLGQSYGGFINTTYLSIAPEGLSEVYFTGGLPGLVDIDTIYQLTYQRTAARNRVYFDRYPRDAQTLKNVLKHLRDTEETLPTGERLTGRRLRMLGMNLGGDAGFDQLHYFFEDPFVTVRGTKRLNTQFLDMVWRNVSMGDNPMYGLLHETIYAGTTPKLAGQATNWGAWRLVKDGNLPGFEPEPDLQSSDPIYLTGEHIYPWLFDEDPALVPMRNLAHRLASFTDWPTLYDPEVLQSNDRPCAGAVYLEDMFVPVELSRETARCANVRTWVTNEYQHDGIRAGSGVLKHLMELAHR
ncbi:alpha/beta fold hydrolase [Gleimia hominis]|uniref:Ribonuclease H n=1 Tax=Gleimia hominis TaxID=595468 RepID=A0ABU3I8Y9_9ACTO|nr:alpha/beta fold hydrolase [Gleimia hominis]MDT3766839.1 alpha/beta fold hydrolase [Gleimia hominis]